MSYNRSIQPLPLPPALTRFMTPIDYGKGHPLQGRVYRIEKWHRWPIERQLAFLRAYTEHTAHDPALVDLAATICAECPPRDGQARWAKLLAWVQQKIRYENEPGERIQSPQYTLSREYGDCDDLSIVLAALGHALRLEWRWVIVGKDKASGRTVRFIERSGPVPGNVGWHHIYLTVGWPAFKPTGWAFAEPTLQVPLGWDIVSSGGVIPQNARLSKPGRPASRTPGQLMPELAAAMPEGHPAQWAARSVQFVRGLDWRRIVEMSLPPVITALALGELSRRSKKR